jgi:hypothetical protein
MLQHNITYAGTSWAKSLCEKRSLIVREEYRPRDIRNMEYWTSDSSEGPRAAWEYWYLPQQGYYVMLSYRHLTTRSFADNDLGLCSWGLFPNSGRDIGYLH